MRARTDLAAQDLLRAGNRELATCSRSCSLAVDFLLDLGVCGGDDPLLARLRRELVPRLVARGLSARAIPSVARSRASTSIASVCF